MDKKKGLYLVLGIVATVAFGVFSSHIYELMFYDNNYSNAMYNYGVYGIMAMITIAIAWGAAALFYYVGRHAGSVLPGQQQHAREPGARLGHAGRRL